MKLSRFTQSQIINLLKQAEAGASAPNLCREHGMSSASFINGGLNTVAWMPPWCLA